jgi:hypothetical protein
MGRTLFSAGEVCGGFLVAAGLVITVRAQNAEGLGTAHSGHHRSAEEELQRLDDEQANEQAARMDDEDFDDDYDDNEDDDDHRIDVDDDETAVVGKLGSTGLDRPALFRGLGGSRTDRGGDTIELVSRNSHFSFSASSSPDVGDILSFGASPPRYEREPDITPTPCHSPVENTSML